MGSVNWLIEYCRRFGICWFRNEAVSATSCFCTAAIEKSGNDRHNKYLFRKSENSTLLLKLFEPDSYLEDGALSSNSMYQFWMLYGNDYLQYQLGLMDEEIWQAKLTALRRTYNAYQFRPKTDLVLHFVSAGLSNFIRKILRMHVQSKS